MRGYPNSKIRIIYHNEDYLIITNQATNSVFIFYADFITILELITDNGYIDESLLQKLGYSNSESIFIVDFLLKLGLTTDIYGEYKIDYDTVNKLDQYGDMITLYKYNNQIFDIQFEITNDCNLHCRHCYINNKSKNVNITTKTFECIAKEIINLNPISITLTGGELMVCKDWFKYYDFFYDNLFIISIISNLTMLSDNIIDILAIKKPKYIQTSIHGDEIIHDMITGVKGSFHKTIDSIKKLKQKNINVTVNYLITSKNYHCVTKMSKFFREIQVPVNLDYKIFPKRDGNTNFQQEMITNNMKDKNYFKSIEQNSQCSCTAIRGKLRIDQNGSVYPCEYINHELGNLTIEPINEILANEKTKKVLGIIDAYSPQMCKCCDNVSICIKCPAFYINSLNKNLDTSGKEYIPDMGICNLIKGGRI